MAETTEKAKKAKAPAKPRATAAAPKKAEAKVAEPKAAAKKPVDAQKPAAAQQRQTVAEKVTASTPTHDEIALLARQYWVERGHQDGQHEQDWLRAEQELLKLAS
ncbi:MAG TPA: DUF2934 domain-containing protein [Acidobacteriaceae bacterium]|nr:DUF2934 domain-containing protein [Acidobacteriaceae bacterium]